MELKFKVKKIVNINNKKVIIVDEKNKIYIIEKI